jgi:hypothetical protein
MRGLGRLVVQWLWGCVSADWMKNHEGLSKAWLCVWCWRGHGKPGSIGGPLQLRFPALGGGVVGFPLAPRVALQYRYNDQH